MISIQMNELLGKESDAQRTYLAAVVSLIEGL